MNYMRCNPHYSTSHHLYEKSKEVLVPGSSTISKRPDLFPFGAYPIYIAEAKGQKVKDIDGNEYIDFQSSCGAIILGHNYPQVNEAIREQLSKGILYPLSNPQVVTLAQKLCHIVSPPGNRIKARILKNGSDATTGAVRIARAYTKKEKILACHYHGWHDWYYISTSLNHGIPSSLKESIIPFEYNNLDMLEKLFEQHQGEVAAVIMEVTHLNPPDIGYLHEVKQIVKRNSALLIFDEVVTGFRFALGGAQSYYREVPDISCFAKGLGNGMPISAIVGEASIMDATQDVVTTQTYGEECLSVAASLATLDVLSNHPVSEHIWQLGSYFKNHFNELAQKYHIPVECVGLGPRLEIVFDEFSGASTLELKSYLLQEMAKDGLLIGHTLFMTWSHTLQDVEKLLRSSEKILQKLSYGWKYNSSVKLDGNVLLNLW